jgi:dolichol-phosphate mannosyltransferase
MDQNLRLRKTHGNSDVGISVVVPIYNEEENIPDLYAELAKSFDSPAGAGVSVEFLFVNDGSVDSSLKLVKTLRETDSRVKLVDLSRNFGQQAAITAGIDFSRGDAVILMDGDLQDPPSLLIQMIEIWKNGADVVYAVRRKRKESALMRGTYYLYYRLLRKIANIDIPVDSGDFCLMDRRVIDQLKKMPERNRFLRGLRSWVGFNQVSLPYERQARSAGEAKYTFRKLLQLGLSGIFSFSSFPLRLATYLGFAVCLIGVISLAVVVAAYFIGGSPPQGWTSLFVLVLFIGGVQLLILGAIGEYVALIHDEVKQRPNYVIREFLD